MPHPRGAHQVKYSICMTCFNEASFVRDSLNSLLEQIDEDYEVVVVDNFSHDGTYEILQEFEKTHGIRVIRRRCSRGLGRQIAFENSSGVYVLANLDLDDIFKPVIRDIVFLYHERFEGEMVVVYNLAAPSDEWVQNITIAPRRLISSLGGWRDVNIYEDLDFWSRANLIQKYHWTTYAYSESKSSDSIPRGAISRLIVRYEKYRDKLRLRKKIFSSGEKISMSQFLPYVAARVFVLLHGSLRGNDPTFDPLDPRLYAGPMAAETSNSKGGT